LHPHSYPQNEVPYDSRPAPQSNNSSYQSPYSFDPPAYYQNSNIPTQNGFNQPAPQNIQRDASQPPPLALSPIQNPLSAYGAMTSVHGNMQVCADLFSWA
jgi:hypothetical protein